MKFDFFSPSRVIFGAGEISRLGSIAAELGRSILLVHNGPGPAIEELLRKPNLSVLSIRQGGEPTVDDIDHGLRQAREGGCDLIIGAGGGSAIDAAKAIAGLLTNGGSALDYMEVIGRGQKITKPACPWIAVPTTAGTGAEATRNAVVGYPPKQFKASIRSELLFPRLCLIDPQLQLDVPPEVTASSGMDALCQLIESYTSTGAGPITDALALKGVQLAARSLRRAYHDGHDLAAREDMALAAFLSGICLANAGLGAVHGFAAPLGANFPIPHGTVCAALLPGVVEANISAARLEKNTQTLDRYATLGRTMADNPALSDSAAGENLIELLRQYAAELRIPRLGQFGLARSRVPEMVQLARKASSMKYNPVRLTDEQLGAVLSAAIG